MIRDKIDTSLRFLGPLANYPAFGTGWAFNFHSDWINSGALHHKLK